jgi:hypothetical protein
MGAVVRHATDSPVGHAVMYIGKGQIVQARYPKVVVSDAPTSNIIWAYGQPLTPGQRELIVARALQLVGDGYDVAAFPFFIAAVFDAVVLKDEAPLLNKDHFRVCSAIIADCDSFAGAPITQLPDPNLVRPSDLMNVGLVEGWFGPWTAQL